MTIENKQISSAQQGFATVLIVLLVGLAVAASALGTAYYINMSQKSLVSSHALTNAQSGAWTGVEILRQYLEILAKDGSISSLNEESFLSLNVQGKTCNLQNEEVCPLQVKIISSKEVGTDSRQFRVTANIQNISEKSEASSTIQAVYLIDMVSNNSNAINNTSINAIDIYGDLNVSGGIEIKGGKDAIINIYGNLTSSGNTFTGVSELNVTGNVKLSGGGEKIKTITSNADVYLGAGTEVDYVYAKGKVTVDTGKQGGEIYADKDIIIKNGGVKVANTLNNIELSSGGIGEKLVAGGYITVSNGSVGTAHAQGNISFKGNAATALVSGGDITVSNGSVGTVKAVGKILAKGGNITNALAKGNITLDSNSVTLTNSTTEKYFICNAEWWSNLNSIYAQEVKYLKTNCLRNSSASINTSSIPTVSFSINEPEKPTGSTKTVIISQGIKINANDYLSDANYIFSTDSNGRIKVKVQNVWNQSKTVDYTGDYYLAKIRIGGNKDWKGNEYTGYLCSQLQENDNQFCKYDTNRTVEYIKHNEWYTEEKVTVDYKYHYQLKLFPNEPNTTNGQFITYENNTKTWILAVTDSKHSTTNIEAPTTPSLAPGIMFFYGNLNIGQGSYTNTMIATGDINASIPAVYSPNYSGADKVCNVSGYQMPINLCISTSVLTKIDVANNALIAGSCANSTSLASCKLTYTGGNINLSSSAYIYGNIIAGSRFNTSGRSSVSGSITSANLGTSSLNSSSFNSNLTIDLTNVDSVGIGSSEDNTSDTNDIASIVAKVKWARYI